MRQGATSVSRVRSRFARAVLLVLGNLAVLIIVVALIEGLASLAVFARSARWQRIPAERQHTRYDAELGWVSVPSLRIQDLYGPGASLTTNAWGFRGKADVAVNVPSGKIRLVCSGDSFTLGFGVDDDQTWCHRLTRVDPVLETVNMGQGGYGADQAYLWYRRDGAKIEHQIHLFAFITDDFRRMRRDRFLGYAKPWLSRDGQVRNVPVPPASYGPLSWLVRQTDVLSSLRMVQLTLGLAERAGLSSAQGFAGRDVLTLEDSRLALRFIIEDLHRHHRSRGSRLVLVHLPTGYELRSVHPQDWFDFFMEISDRLGVEYVNLFGPFSAMGPAAWRTLYISPGEIAFPAADGHYSAAGNQVVAELLHKALSPLAR